MATDRTISTYPAETGAAIPDAAYMPIVDPTETSNEDKNKRMTLIELAVAIARQDAIVDYLNRDKKYVATLIQTGTFAPVATILKNNLSAAIVWTRQSEGIFIGTLTGAFAARATIDMMDKTDVDYCEVVNANSVKIVMNGDGVLNDQRVEINVYAAPSS